MGLAIDAARGRLLTREEIGIFVGAMWLLGLVQSVGDAGFAAALISDRKLNARQVTANWDCMMAVAGVGTAAVIAAAPAVAAWNHSALVGWVAAAAALVFVLQTVAAFHVSLLSRDLRFGSLARAELVGVAAQLGLTVVLALAGAGVWALVGAAAGAQAARAAALRAATRWRAHRPADYSHCRDHATLATNLTGSRLLFYGYTNFDYFVLSRWAAKGTLAAYYNAYRLAAIPAMIVSKALQQVAFASLAAVKHDLAELRVRFLTVTRYAAMTGAPAAVGLFVVADDAVAVIYGPGWEDAAHLLRLLAAAGAVHSLRIAGPSLFLAVGRADRNMAVSLSNAIVLIPAMLVGVRWGAQGVAMTWLALGTPLDLAVLLIAARTIGIGASAAAAAVAPSFVRAMGMGIVTYGVGSWGVVSSLSAPFRLTILVVTGAVIYCGWTGWREPEVRRRLAAARRRLRVAWPPMRGTGLDT